MSKSDSFVFPLGHVWFLAIPLLPLILATCVFQWVFEPLGDPAKPLDFLKIETLTYVKKPIQEFVHLGDMLIYLSFVSIHVVVCTGVIIYLFYVMRQLPSRALQKSVIFTGVIALLVVCLVVFFALMSNQLVIVQLGYKAICMTIETAKLSTSLTSDCLGGITKLTWLAWIPTFWGMSAVVVAAGFAYGNADGLPPFEDAEWRTVFNERSKGLQKSLYALSAVLVSSTIAITLFAHLPAGLLNAKSGLATAFSNYAIGLSTFWGALFSLTLAATFAAPAFLLWRQAHGYQSVAEDAADLRAWLHENLFVSIKKQLMNVASLLAPLLVGPLSSLLSSLAGA